MSTTEERMVELCEKFEQHVVRFEQHELDEGEKFDKLIKAQQANTDAIAVLTESVSSLVDDTSSIIKIHKDFQGAVRVGSGVQNFMLWLMKWGVIGAGLATLVMWVIDHFQN
jgi:hypothetical protein